MDKRVEFSEAIAQIVTNDKMGLVGFLKSEGVKVSENVDDKILIEAIMKGFKSDMFVDSFKTWLEKRYQSGGSANFSNASGGFDPNQATSSEFESDSFAGFSGALISQDDLDYGKSMQKNTMIDSGQSGFGKFMSGIDFSSLINTGVGIWQTERESDQTKALTNAQIRAEELKLEALKEQGKLNTQDFERQLALLQKGGGKDNTMLYVIGGVVVLGALITTVVLVTRKK